MPNTITINSKVKIKINGQLQELQVVGSADVNPKVGKISYLSPVGGAILGKKENDDFMSELPSGKIIKGQVIEIKN